MKIVCPTCGAVNGCENCTRVLHTGEGRVLVGLTVKELTDLVNGTTMLDLRERLLRAIALLDDELARELW